MEQHAVPIIAYMAMQISFNIRKPIVVAAVSTNALLYFIFATSSTKAGN